MGAVTKFTVATIAVLGFAVIVAACVQLFS